MLGFGRAAVTGCPTPEGSEDRLLHISDDQLTHGLTLIALISDPSLLNGTMGDCLLRDRLIGWRADG